MNRHLPVRGLMLLAVLQAGCITSWQTQPAAPAQVIQTSGESEIRVNLNSGTSVVLRDPWVEGDSLIGWQVPGSLADAPVERRALAVADVRAISLKKSSTAANIAVGAVLGAAVFVASIGAAWWIGCGVQGCD